MTRDFEPVTEVSMSSDQFGEGLCISHLRLEVIVIVCTGHGDLE